MLEDMYVKCMHVLRFVQMYMYACVVRIQSSVSLVRE